MSAEVANRAQGSKSGTGQLSGQSRTTGGQISPILLRFKKVFANKTAHELSLRTGADLSHCEKCLAGRRELGSQFLQQLLRSDFGRHALDAIMEGSDAAWFKGFKKHLRLSELRRAHIEHGRAIAALESGEGGE